MKRRLAILAAAAAAVAALVTATTPAGAQQGARIHLIHGIPDTPVDVDANGQTVIRDFRFGGTEDLSSLAGQTLSGVQVKAAGTNQVLIDAGDVAFPASGNVTAIAHLDAAGNPMLTVFDNDTSPIPAGQGRLVVRHTAAAPAVDVRANAQVVFADLTNPNEAQADLPAGTVSAEVVPAGATQPVVIGPTDLPITEGSSLIVYAVGSLDQGTIQTLTETISGLGTAPSGIAAGNSPVSDDAGSALPGILTAGSLALVASVIAGRRIIAARRA